MSDNGPTAEQYEAAAKRIDKVFGGPTGYQCSGVIPLKMHPDLVRDFEEIALFAEKVIECRRAVAVPPESGWRPIETAPKNGVPVLCYAPADYGLPSLQAVVTWHQDAGWCVDELREVTHWMPLPPAPKENSRE